MPKTDLLQNWKKSQKLQVSLSSESHAERSAVTSPKNSISPCF